MTNEDKEEAALVIDEKVESRTRYPSGPYLTSASDQSATSTPTKPGGKTTKTRLSTASVDSVFESTPKGSHTKVSSEHNLKLAPAPHKIKSPRRIEHDNDSDESDLPDLEETPTDMNDFLPQLEELDDLPKLEEIDTNSKPKRKRKSATLETTKVPHLSPVKRHRRGIRRKPTIEAAYV